MDSIVLLWKIFTLKYRGPNERNTKGSSITRNFHLSWGQETCLRAKNSEFSRHASLCDHMFAFAFILIPVALLVIPKVEFNFKW